MLLVLSTLHKNAHTTTASAILDQVQNLATFEAFGTFKHTLRYGVVWYWFHWISASIWTLFSKVRTKVLI